MIDTLAVPPSPVLATTSTTDANSRSGCQEHPPIHSSLPSSTSVAHLSPTFPAHHAPPPSVRSTTATPSATDQPSPSSSPSSSLDAIPSPSHNTSPTATSSAVAVRMDASPVILFTLQYSVAVVQGVTIYILSVVFSILQLVSGQLNDGSPPSSSSGSSGGSSVISASRKRSEDEERRQQRQQQRRRRRRWSGNGINSATGTGTTTFTSTLTAETSTSVRGWAQNLIIGHTQSQSNPVEGSANAAGGGATPTPGGGEGGAGTLAQRVEVLRFLGSTIASLVGSYARPTSSTAFSSASGEGAVESKTSIKRQLSSSLSKASGAAEAGEMNYSSRIRRALVKTLSGHAIPLPRSIKRVTFNDTLQFHTTTTNRRRARFGDEDDEEEEDEEDEDEDEADSTSSSPVLRFFSAGFSGTSELAISPKAPMSTSPSTSTPSPVPGRGSWKKEKKNRPPSIMPSARDRLQLQDQDDLEDLAAATLQQEDVRSGGVFNVVSNGRSIPVSTTTMTPGASTMGKKLASTITIALPPLSRPRKQQPLAPQQQQQQQAQMPVSPMFSITATSTSSAAATTTSTATTTTTTTTTSMTMTVPTSYTPSSGTSGLASALLSSLMMPAAPGPISDAARSLLTSTSTSTPTSAPPTVDTFAPALSDSDSSKGSTGRGGHLKRTRSAPSKISTFLQQHRLTRQQQQQSGQMQGQGLFSPGEYTSSPRDLVSSPKSALLPTTAGFAKSTATSTTTASTDSTTETQISSCTTTAPTIDVNVRARQPSVSSTSSTSTTTLIRPRSLHSIQSTVSSAVAAVIIGTGVPPPSVPISLTTSMSRSLSPPRVGPAAIAATTTMVTAFSPTHQRRRSASIDLGMSTPNLSTSYSSPKEDTSTPGADSVVDIAPTGSGGRSLMYKLTHPQRYKRELELQLQSQSQKDTSSLSSASSSPSASQVVLSPLSPTFSPTSSTTSSIQGTLQPESSSSSSAVKVVYPFSRSFTDLPPSLSYLSDDPHPVHLPPPHTYTPASVAASVSVDNSLSPSSSTTNVATFGEIYQPQPLSLNTRLPAIGDKEGIPAAVRESTTPPLSMFFPSPTSQHRAPLPSPTLALSSMKDTLAQLRRSPSPRPRRSVAEDEDGASNAHTTFAACGFSISSSSS